MTMKAASPIATGPAGPLFEAQVAASYLLALLLEAEPRGLPGGKVSRIQLQGATDGHPLDDVVLHAVAADGAAATLDIQAKHSIRFSPGDPVFHAVMGQIAEAVKAGRLDDPYYGMAVATAQSSRKIDGPYQEVLHWARKARSADFFFRKLKLANVANQDMRTFVITVQAKLAEFGAPADDRTVWQVLCKLQILVFDFAEQGQSEMLVRERCAQLLDAGQQNLAGTLWSVLTTEAQSIAKAGSEIDLAGLRAAVTAAGLALIGVRQNRPALAALAEKSLHALEGIRDRVASAHLARRPRLDLVNASLDQGRFVMILGDAGVGKSGILRALAEQLAVSSNIILLTPARITPRGWSALRQEIGYLGSARDLLGELAVSGGGTIFVDSADMLDEAQRATVNDLVRDAAHVPGFSVIVTARRSFGVEEPNWLPAEALTRLGVTPAVVIDELSDDEVDELRSAAPELAPLLAPGHPAQEAVRNLFRLDWLYQYGQRDHAPRTETEMALRWFDTGDGNLDAGARDRRRILRNLAQASLTGDVGPIAAEGFDSGPLNALLRSGSLVEPRPEQVAFRHDVFRDWSIANLLHGDPAFYDSLPLARPAPASLFRGVELAARLALDNQSDAAAWKIVFDRLNATGVHGSWRRAATLALVRSENSTQALDLAQTQLLESDGALLRDLVRTVMAVDTVPASQLLSGLGVTLADDAADFPMPVGPAWRRLMLWTLRLKACLPAKAVPDVAKLYGGYATALLFPDPLAGVLVAHLHAWLMMIEGAPSPLGTDGPPAACVDYDNRSNFHGYLRSVFLTLSGRRPDLAEQYLQLLLQNDKAGRHSAEAVILSPGDLATAAPAALAKLTAKTLINIEVPKRHSLSRSYGDDEPFTFADKRFLSPSPARGPFLDLLMKAPATGLALVRQIVSHACRYDARAGGSSQNDDALTLEFPDGPRRFPYQGSYYWSRDGQGSYSVTSALMALEAWAHHRVDGGDDVAAVIADILGDGESPAAFLLVAIDVILSHRSKAIAAAIPFAGSPELLSRDRSRVSHDRMAGNMGLFGDPEPRGIACRDSLSKRRSRGTMLEDILPHYAFNAEAAERDALRAALQKAVAELPAYESHSDFGDPRFMARYALNLLERENYESRVVQAQDGQEFTAFQYVFRPDEVTHLQGLHDTRGAHLVGAEQRAEISLALNDPARSSPELVSRAVPWAKAAEASGEPQESFDNSILIAAFLLMRDGADAQRQEHAAWALAQFATAVAVPEDHVHRMRSGLLHNPVGIGTAGLLLHASATGQLADARVLLEIASRGDPAAAHGFRVFADRLDAIDPRLAKAILRCAIAAGVRPHLKRYDDHGEDARRQAQAKQWHQDALDSEWRWLTDEGPEPDWTVFPDPNVSVRSKMVLGDAQARKRRAPNNEAFYADHDAGALWLNAFVYRAFEAPAWLQEVAANYRVWTAKLNGVDLNRHDELSREPSRWNSAYFAIVARSLVGRDEATVDALCLTSVTSLPDEPFLDVMAALLGNLDAVHFNNKGPSPEMMLHLRGALIERLKQTSQWRRFANDPGYGIPYHLDEALGTAFMCHQGFRQPPSCYVRPPAVARAEVFIDLLTGLALATPSLYVAKAVLSIISVSPDHPFLAFGVKAIAACMTAFPNDTTFWIGYSVGDEFCKWLDGVLSRFGQRALDEAAVRAEAETLLSELIRLGVPSAVSLEMRTVATV